MWSLYLDSLVSVFEMIDLVEVVMVKLQELNGVEL